jgi:hypothetical protein
MFLHIVWLKRCLEEMPLSRGMAGSIRGVPRVGVCFILSRHRFLQSSTPPPQIWIAYPGPISQQFEKSYRWNIFPARNFVLLLLQLLWQVDSYSENIPKCLSATARHRPGYTRH